MKNRDAEDIKRAADSAASCIEAQAANIEELENEIADLRDRLSAAEADRDHAERELNRATSPSD